MTVCVSVKVHDCLIFAADSASSLIGRDDEGRPSVLNVWQHGNKVFNLFKGKPIVAMTCGMGIWVRLQLATWQKTCAAF